MQHRVDRVADLDGGIVEQRETHRAWVHCPEVEVTQVDQHAAAVAGHGIDEADDLCKEVDARFGLGADLATSPEDAQQSRRHQATQAAGVDQVCQCRHILGQRIKDRLQWLGEGLHLLQHRCGEVAEERAEIELDVAKRQLRH